MTKQPAFVLLEYVLSLLLFSLLFLAFSLALKQLLNFSQVLIQEDQKLQAACNELNHVLSGQISASGIYRIRLDSKHVLEVVR